MVDLKPNMRLLPRAEKDSVKDDLLRCATTRSRCCAVQGPGIDDRLCNVVSVLIPMLCVLYKFLSLRWLSYAINPLMNALCITASLLNIFPYAGNFISDAMLRTVDENG